MRERKTIESFKKEVFDLVGEEYTVVGEYNGTNNKIDIRHNKCGNIITPRAVDFLRGIRCKYCSGKYKRTNEEFTKKVIELEGGEYTPLDKYKNSSTKIRMLHKSCGYIYNVTPSAFLSGQRCPKCAKNMKKDTEIFSKEVIEKTNGEYQLVNEYVNSKTKVKILHNTCGTIYETLPASFSSGHRCPYCNLPHKESLKTIKNRVYGAVGDEYSVLKSDGASNVQLRHNICGHIYSVGIYNFLNKGYRCQKCKGNYQKTTKEIKDRIENDAGKDFQLIGEYINSDTKITIKHLTCKNVFQVRANDFFLNVNKCPYCALVGTSLQEKQLINFIKESCESVVLENDRTILDGKEIDIYIPNKKIGVEFDGLYWHSTACNTDTNYHLNKTKLANENNVRLVHIFEDEWRDKQKIVKDKLSHMLGINNSKRIYARKCIVREIPSKDRNMFLNNNHIQGADGAVISLGLFYNEDLVSVMSFCKPRINMGQRDNDDNVYELSRYASLLEHSVIGGFSKLLKYAIKNYKIDEVYTYADLRWTDESNNMYVKNGFILDSISKPNYFYLTSGRYRENRFKYRKSELKKMFPSIYNDNLSEKEIMELAGYYRIYDCGNLKYRMNEDIIKKWRR